MSKPNAEISAYIENLPPGRKEAIAAVRELILETVPQADETMRYRMPTYEAGGDFLAALASQKQYMSLYASTVSVEEHADKLSHLNCGKSCIRFRKLDDLPLDVVRVILQETYARNQSAHQNEEV